MAAPVAYAVTQNVVPAAGGTRVEVIGANLDSTLTATVGAVAATGIVWRSQFYAHLVTPAHAAGATDLVLTTAGGTVTMTGAVRYV